VQEGNWDDAASTSPLGGATQQPLAARVAAALRGEGSAVAREDGAARLIASAGSDAVKLRGALDAASSALRLPSLLALGERARARGAGAAALRVECGGAVALPAALAAAAHAASGA
jgi:hypothetical protein